MEEILLSWSGGKDSVLALYEILRAGRYRVAALVTTVTEEYDRISMHGVRRVLLERQCESLGCHLDIIYITPHATNEEYERQMDQVLRKHKATGINRVAFGDIFLEDLRKYREEKLAQVQMEALFPIWKRDTKELSQSLIDLGFKTITTCVDSKVLDKKYVGRIIDNEFLKDLPKTVDKCGENGEYHSFVYDGPIFKKKVDFRKGKVLLRDERFFFCDLVPV